MPTLIVTDDAKDWPSELPEVEVVDAWSYLTGARFAGLKGVRLFNLCKSYRYQNAGYYVSLLAEARGHRPLPSITTIQDMKSPAMVRLIGEDLDDRIQKDLHPLQSESFTLSVYFGRNVAKRYDTLSRHLVRPVPRTDAPGPVQEARRQVAAPRRRRHRRQRGPRGALAVRRRGRPRVLRRPPRRRSSAAPTYRYDLAILRNPNEAEPPSDEKALQKFTKAAEAVGLAVEVITPDDYGRIAEFDALFIRETTAPTTTPTASPAAPPARGSSSSTTPSRSSAARTRSTSPSCSATTTSPRRRPWSPTRRTSTRCSTLIGLPCVLKQPDSSFSRGVIKVETAEALRAELDRFRVESDLVVAQEFLPTTFDWRIGILDGQPLFACKYYMARKHWQIIKRDAEGKSSYGKFETLPVELAPRKAVRIATRAAELIGDGLYGVDVKQSGDQFYVIEVNDNPNIEAGIEDAILRDELYRRLADVFLRRIERRKAGYGGGNNRP